MKAPEAVIAELLKQARAILYSRLPDHCWFAQQTRVKFALTLPAKRLDEFKVELSAERYQAIVGGILDTIKANGRRDLGSYPCAYLHHCVETHLRHHLDEYYAEGKSVRNAVTAAMSFADRAHVGADGTIPVLTQVNATLAVGKRKPKAKPIAPPSQSDLFAPPKPKISAKSN